MRNAIFHRQDIYLAVYGIFVGTLIGFLSEILKLLIHFVTNVAYYGRFSFQDATPAGHALGDWAFVIPVVGGLLIGLMARFVNKEVYGHGIPETMEKILLKDSLIQKRMMFLKPLAAAISIGTGGPFGDEGPIIATGGAVGSATGQWLPTNSYERRVLLACGAAGAVSAAFGSPLGGIFLAVELMLFELKPQSLVPVVLSALTADLIRIKWMGESLAFAMPNVPLPADAMSLVCYFSMGLLIGFVSVGVVHSVHFIELLFEKSSLHWMWWPALGGVFVGLFGLLNPHVLGAGYETIEAVLAGKIIGLAAVSLCGLKFLTWLVGVSSRTTAGTLAPVFLIGSSLGVSLFWLFSFLFPSVPLDVKVAALVGMCALFCGVTHAMLASVFIGLESTHQFWASIPVLAGCVGSYLVSLLFMQYSLLTKDLVKKGVKI